MQALKLKGKVDETGKLIVSKFVNLMPGEVEIIVLQTSDMKTETEAASTESLQAADHSSDDYPVRALANWYANRPPADPTFDADEARWQHLKERYNL